MSATDRHPSALASLREIGRIRHRSATTPIWVTAVVALGVAVYLVGTVWALLDARFVWIHAALVAPVLVALTVPIAQRIARNDGDGSAFAVIMGALTLKLLGSLVRYWVAFVLYEGVADANQYHDFGAYLAPRFTDGVFAADVGPVVGTGFVRILTGVVYVVTGAYKLGGFLVFGWMAFLGMLLFWRAFKLAVPQGNSHRYALLVLLLPSLVYWPSSIGKDSWMVLVLGITSFGLAQLLTGRLLGLATVTVGLAGIAMCRPHVGLVVLVGVALAVVLPSRKGTSRSGIRLVAAILLLVMGAVVLSQTEQFLGVDNLTQETAQNKLTEVVGRTEQGGSAFTPVKVESPLDFPAATLTVLFRPFPWEARNLQSVLAAAEGLLLFVLVVISWPSVRNTWAQMRTSAYVSYAVGYLIAFVVAFSSFGNFGILARQRVQMLPLFLVLLALPPRRARVRPARSARSGADLDPVMSP